MSNVQSSQPSRLNCSGPISSRANFNSANRLAGFIGPHASTCPWRKQSFSAASSEGVEQLFPRMHLAILTGRLCRSPPESFDDMRNKLIPSGRETREAPDVRYIVQAHRLDQVVGDGIT